jgi:CTP:molybdopterin cytidylyltransferase MocA
LFCVLKVFGQAVSITLIAMSIAAILLAAGASQRLGQPKQLLEFEGETLIVRALRLAQEAGASPLVAVLGAHHEKIGASIQTKDVTAVINRDWKQGIATSICAGLRTTESLNSAVPGVLVLTCDQPRLTANHLRALLRSFSVQTTPCCVASSYAGICGTPAVFPRSTFPDLYALRGDRGARTLFRDPTRSLVTLPFPGGEIDIDVPDDLAHLERQAPS